MMKEPVSQNDHRVTQPEPIKLEAMVAFHDCERRGAWLQRIRRNKMQSSMSATALFRRMVLDYLSGVKYTEFPKEVRWDRQTENEKILRKQIERVKEELLEIFGNKHDITTEEEHRAFGISACYDILNKEEGAIQHFILNISTVDPTPSMARELAVYNEILKVHYRNSRVTHHILHINRARLNARWKPVFKRLVPVARSNELGIQDMLTRLIGVVYNGEHAYANPASFRCTKCVLNNMADCPERYLVPTLKEEKENDHQ